MKRIISFICALALLLALPVFSSAAADPVISVESVEAQPGESVEVEISISGNPGILGARISISYAEELTLTSVAKGPAFSELVMTKPGDLSANPVNILWDGIEDAAESDGVIAVLTFTAPEDYGSYPIRVSYRAGDIADENLAPVSVTLRAGEITVTNNCDHVFGKTPSDEIASEATCTEPARYYVKCDKCGEINYELTVAVGTALNHRFGDWEVVKEATCTEKGTEKRTCTRSGCSVSETSDIDVLGHEFGTWTVVKEATCTEKGTEKRTCTRSGCSASETRDIDVLGHEFGAWTVVKAATCTEKGTEKRTCTRSGCSASETRDVDVLGHKFGTWTVVKAATCTEKGTEKRTCTRSGCSVSETRDIDVLGHKFGAWTVVKEATCTEKGTEKRTCTRSGCSVSETRDIDILGHKFGAWTVVKEATCTEKGTEKRTCTRSGCSVSETRDIDVLGHKFGAWTVVKEATCTEKGTEKRTCTRSGCSASETRDIDVLGHKFGAWTVVKEATCTEKGTEKRSCTRSDCSVSETRDVDALGHSKGKAVRENIVPATDKRDGSYDEVIYCTRCDLELSRKTVTVSKLGDDFFLPMVIEGYQPPFPFEDVSTSAWFYTAVKSAWSSGLISGVTATRFAPDDSLTAAQAIKLSASLHQLLNQGTVTLKNGSDVWYSTYVAYAVDKGLIEPGYAAYTAEQLGQPVTRAEFVHIFHNAVKNLHAMNTVSDGAIPDVKAGDAFASEIYDFYRAGIAVGSDAQGTFKPGDTIKRSEASALLDRMYNISARKAVSLG